MKNFRNARKLPGITLVETLMAFCVLSIVIPTSLGALGSVLMADLKINERASMVSASEWWFGRLSSPARAADIDASPRTDPHGKSRFEWETEDLSYGAVRVTLRVYGRLSGSVFTVSRIL